MGIREELKRPVKSKPFRVRVDEERERRYLQALTMRRRLDASVTMSDAIREAMDRWSDGVISSAPVVPHG